jgi:hypothetical protein
MMLNLAHATDLHVAPSSRRRELAGSARMSVSPRWLALALTSAGIGLLPWMFYLAVSLPASPQAWHWPAAWVGLDGADSLTRLRPR